MEGLEASKHYERLAEDFEEAWFFSADYRPWLVEQMISYLRLTPLDYLCDIGGGTGNFTAVLCS
jgi:predicted TPR repeat methyltransferase